MCFQISLESVTKAGDSTILQNYFFVNINQVERKICFVF